MISVSSNSVIFKKIHFLQASLSLPPPFSLCLSSPPTDRTVVLHITRTLLLGVICEQDQDPQPHGADLLAEEGKTISNKGNKNRSKLSSAFKGAPSCGERKGGAEQEVLGRGWRDQDRRL